MRCELQLEVKVAMNALQNEGTGASERARTREHQLRANRTEAAEVHGGSKAYHLQYHGLVDI